jgi:type I restriction enzyme S subunit
MSYLEKLLNGVEVEWKTLGECIKSLKTGLNPRQNFQLNTSDAENYYVTVREIQNGKIVFVEQTDRVNAKALELINNRSNLEEGDILFSGTGTVGRIAVIEEKPVNWNIKEGVYVIKPEQSVLMSKFLAYTLNSGHIVKEFSKKIVGSPVCSLPMSELKKLQIPIPPLSVQKEIVRILDSFTELTAELTAELLKRRVQYKYYMTLLFDNVKESDLHSIAKVCHIEKGTTPIQKAIPGKYPMVVTTTERKSCETYQFDAKAVCIPLVSSRGHGVASLNQVYYQEGKFALGNILCAIIPKNEEQVCSKYLYYYFQLTKEYTLVPLMKGGANVALRINDIEKVKVPIPSLEEQSRIVSILDKFDTLTNSISEGLPKEIELRKKQYEYYRDLLLTFPKNNIES